MIFGIYAIRDSKTGFMPPTYDQNDASAMRNFAHAVQTSGTILNTHSQDFELYKLGTFDSLDGHIIVLDVKELIAEGYQMKEAKADV